MLPTRPIFNLAHNRRTYTKFTSQNTSAFTGPRPALNSPSLRLSQLCPAAGFAPRSKTYPRLVSAIVGKCQIFKVDGKIVQFVAVNVIDRPTQRSGANKGFRDKRVNAAYAANIIFPEIDNAVSVPGNGRALFSPRNDAANPPKVANLIVRVVRNLAPFFNHLRPLSHEQIFGNAWKVT